MEVLRLESGDYQTQLTMKFLKRKPYQKPQNIVSAAIPGTIMEVLVKEGQQVRRGDALCILDSMKMNNTICASDHGVVKKVYIVVGQSVGKDAPMVEFE
ncbi:MAG: acetyl-CoA carboxylase biotin carboxyl carrier protein subunit [Bacteroidales bacterium]|nr:acetyl-CoA carboxylase biotin carboxyl carrier protein subunit [Bacteroidales bacterium]